MGYAVGMIITDEGPRHIGYGVPAVCDYPGCGEDIDRGLGYQCVGSVDGEPCGRYFCGVHGAEVECERCAAGEPPFPLTPDTVEWARHVLTDESWARWVELEPAWADRMRAIVAADGGEGVDRARVARLRGGDS